MTEQTKKRADELFQLGMKYNGADYTLDDFNVNWVEITCDSEDEWTAKIAKIKAEMNRREISK